MGVALGVALRGATFVTTGTSFQFSMFLDFDGGELMALSSLGGHRLVAVRQAFQYMKIGSQAGILEVGSPEVGRG